MNYHQVAIKSILNKKKLRDSWFLDEYTLNPFSGCSFNCLYCYVKGSKYGHSQEKKTSVKKNAVEVLEKQLAYRYKKRQFGFIAFGSATDPYLHFEEDLQLTRQLLEVILRFRFPVHLITKSTLIERDFDILNQINENAILPQEFRGKLSGGMIVSFSFSTVDDKVGKLFEPDAPLPSQRLETMKRTAEQGLKTGVSMMPLFPCISDTGEHLELMFNTYKKHGAHYVLPGHITLFGDTRSDSKMQMLNAIKKHYPELYPKYEKLFGNSDYLPKYYSDAFTKKAEELCYKYELPSKIVSA